MIEEKLLERGISKEQLLAFARLGKHNGKEDRLRWIAEARDWNSIIGKDESEVNFLKNLTEILADIGIAHLKEFSLEENRSRYKYLGEKNYRLYVGEMMAGKMLRTLRNTNYQQYDETLGLDRIFNETFAIEGVKNG